MKKVINIVYIVALTCLFNILFLGRAGVEQLCDYFTIISVMNLFILYLVSKLKNEDIVNDDMIYFITVSMAVIQGNIFLKLLPTDIDMPIKFLMGTLYIGTGIYCGYKHANKNE